MSDEKSANVRRLPKPEPITAEQFAAAGLSDAPATGSEPDIRAELYSASLRASLLSGDAVLSLPPITWLIPEWIPDTSVGALYAPPGTGKSFYALSLALELARGGSWTGHSLEACSVLYVGAEAPAVLGERLRAWKQHHAQAIPDSFHLVPRDPQLHITEQLDALRGIVQELEPRLVVIDTLALSTVGVNENDGTEWGRVGSALRSLSRASTRHTDEGEISAAVLAVHHPGKDLSKGLRGNSNLLAALDYEIRLTAEGANLRAEVSKPRNSAAPRPEYYRLQPVEMPQPSGQLTSANFSSSGAVLVPVNFSEVRRDVVEQILEHLQENRSGATCTDIATALGLTRNPTRAHLNKMTAAGQLELHGTGRATYYTLSAQLLLEARSQSSEELW